MSLSKDWGPVTERVLRTQIPERGWVGAMDSAVALREFVETLSVKESDVLRLILEGYSYHEISPKVGLSLQLVKYAAVAIIKKIEQSQVAMELAPIIPSKRSRNLLRKRLSAAKN